MHLESIYCASLFPHFMLEPYSKSNLAKLICFLITLHTSYSSHSGQCWGGGAYSLSFFFYSDVASLAHFTHSSFVFLLLHQVGWEMSVQLLLDLSRDVQSDSKLDSGSGYSQSGSGASPLRSGPCALGLWIVAPIWGQERSGAGFHPGCLGTLLHSSFPPFCLVFHFLLLQNIPIVWFCHHHASL